MSADLARFVILIFYGLTLGELAWIGQLYFTMVKGFRRLLPAHVVLISFTFFALLSEAVFQNMGRFGEDWQGYTVYNLVAVPVAWLAIVFIRVDVRRNIRDKPRTTPRGD